MAWLSAPEYWLSRLMLERALGLLYLVAFVVALNQFRPLLGQRGLLPVTRFTTAKNATLLWPHPKHKMMF